MTIISYAMRVATQLQHEGKLAQAEMILNSILEAHPDNALALHMLGIIAHQAGKLPQSIALIIEAIRHDPTTALFHTNLGEIYRQSNAIELSIQCGLRAVELDPHSAIAFSNLGVAYYDANNFIEAEKCHQHALSIDPTLSSSLNNLGSIYKNYGRIDDALTFYQKAVLANPQFVESFNNLGIIFLEQQHYNQAAEYFKSGLKITSNSAALHCHLGSALLGLNQFETAKCHFTQALHFKINYAEAYYGLAKAYLNMHYFEDAKHSIHNAIQLNPNKVEFHQLLADIYHTQGKPEKAITYLNQTLTMHPTFLSLCISKGNIYMETGEITKSAAQFAILAKDSPLDIRVLAHYSLAQLHKTTENSLSLQALLSLLEHCHEISPEKRAYLYFGLGKCYEDLNEWDKAFEYFSQGCREKRKRITYTLSDDHKFTQQLIRTFTTDRIEYLRSFGTESRLPIFIVGMPRSGSTLVEQILASHTNVYGAGELTYLNSLIQWPYESHNTTFYYPENIPQLNASVFKTITDNYLSYLRRLSPNATHIIDKMPHNFIAIGLIHALFPQAKIIHIKRNAIDTCFSCYTKLFTHGHFYSYDLTELGQYYRCYERIMAHWRYVLPKGAWHEINYEDIINDFEREAKTLLNYCELPWDASCLTFYRSKRLIRTASFMQVRQPIYRSSINRGHRLTKELAPLVNQLTDSTIFNTVY